MLKAFACLSLSASSGSCSITVKVCIEVHKFRSKKNIPGCYSCESLFSHIQLEILPLLWNSLHKEISKKISTSISKIHGYSCFYCRKVTPEVLIAADRRMNRKLTTWPFLRISLRSVLASFSAFTASMSSRFRLLKLLLACNITSTLRDRTVHAVS